MRLTFLTRRVFFSFFFFLRVFEWGAVFRSPLFHYLLGLSCDKTFFFSIYRIFNIKKGFGTERERESGEDEEGKKRRFSSFSRFSLPPQLFLLLLFLSSF